MAKIKRVGTVGEFMSGSVKDDKKIIRQIIATSGSIALVTIPRFALAATADSTFGNVHGAIMRAFDSGVVLVIIFAAATWGLGHRSKAIELLISICCAYILARHAIDIRNFLKGI
jgi:hypothetical protein